MFNKLVPGTYAAGAAVLKQLLYLYPMRQKIKDFYTKYKQYMVVDVLMYAFMIVMIALLFLFFG